MDAARNVEFNAQTADSGYRRFESKVTRLGDYIGRRARDKPTRSGFGALTARSDLVVSGHESRGLHRGPRQNRLLAALPPDDYERLLPQLEQVYLPRGRIVHEAGCEIEHVYFPVTCIVSLMNELENGTSVEVSAVGNEGVVGVSAFMGGGTTSSRAVVRNAGFGCRLRARALAVEFDTSHTARKLLLRYAQSLVAQTAQAAVCHCHHSIEQQFCRVLLFTQDRLSTNEIGLTQDLVAGLLGVRRESITAAAGKLQADGLIRYHRGRVVIVSRPQLESRVCECYLAVKTEHDRLFGEPTAPKRGDRSVACRAVQPRAPVRVGEIA